MKQLLIIALLLTQFMFGQKGFEVQAFQGATDFNRQKIKVLSTYEHFKGVSHLGIDFERFTVGDETITYNAFGAFVEFGYAFTNFKIPIQIMPLASYGWFKYDGRTGERLLIGLDGAYIINPNLKIHILINLANEKWLVDNETILFGVVGHEYIYNKQNGNNIFIGLSYNL